MACRRLVTGRVGVRLRRWIDAHAFHEFFETCLFAVCATAFGCFDGVQ